MEALLTGGAMGNAEALMAMAAGDQPEYEAPEQEEVSLSVTSISAASLQMSNPVLGLLP